MENVNKPPMNIGIPAPTQPFPAEADEFEQKLSKVGLNKLHMKIIAKGAEKIVLSNVQKKTIKDGPKREPEKVYYIAAKNILLNKTNALKEEKFKMDDIAKTVKDLSNLAVESKDVSESMGTFALEVNKAKCDFEKTIRDPETTIKDRIKLSQDYVKGLTNLHSAGYAYGDSKPENCLIFENTENNTELTLKISDFGKAQKIHDKTATYKGNLRFAPPEGILSQKGDVYSAGLILIRALEEQYLLKDNKISLIDVDKSDQKHFKAIEKRRGIEKYIVEHKAFLGIDEPNFMHKVLRRLPQQVKLKSLSNKQKKMQNTALSQYIEKLCGLMETVDSIGKTETTALRGLLEIMVRSDAHDRPNMEQVTQILGQIFP